MRSEYAAIALFVLFLAPGAAGQAPSVPGQQTPLKPTDMCTVEGVVLKSTTGEPAKKVQVTIYSATGAGQQLSAITDVSGHFLINNITPGRYSMTAGGNGYPAQVYGQHNGRGAVKFLELKPGQQARDIIFHLAPGGVITGTVYDEDGDPVMGAAVQALRFASSPSSPQLISANGAQTNDLGEFRMYGLEAGHYYVAAISPDRGSQNTSSDEVSLPTFHPATPDPAQAVALQVHPGDELSGVDVSLVRVRGVRVSGRLLSEANVKSVQGAYLSLAPRDTKFAGMPFGSYGASVRDEKGDFEIRNVPPGSYVLTSMWNDPNSRRSYSARTTVEVADTDVDGTQLVLSPGMTLHGRINTDPGAKLDYTKLNLWLQPMENMMAGGAGAELSADGTFVIRDVSEGKYRVHLGGFPEEFYVKSAKYAGSSVLDSGLEVSHGGSAGTLEVELTQSGGRVDGTVLHEQKPVPGALVVLVPDPPNRDRDEMYSSKLTDSLGRFSLLGLPPGDFKLFAWERIEGVNFRDSEFITANEGLGTSVHIQEEQPQSVQLELIPAEEQTEY